MCERKVISKYYPPDFDPSKKIKRQRKTQSSAAKLKSVRLSSPFSMRCNRCGEFIYKGRKFDARKQMTGEHYLNIPIVRLFVRCTACSSEIAFDTDFKNEDYKETKGATRNFEPWRSVKHTQQTEDEVEKDALSGLEAKTTNAETEMAVADALEEIMMQNARREIRVRGNTGRKAPTALKDNDQDKEATRRAFAHDAGELVRRLPDQDVAAEAHTKALVYPIPEFQRYKRRRKDYGAALGIKRNSTA